LEISENRPFKLFHIRLLHEHLHDSILLGLGNYWAMRDKEKKITDEALGQILLFAA
jgi:hypothetical protein